MRPRTQLTLLATRARCRLILSFSSPKLRRSLPAGLRSRLYVLQSIQTSRITLCQLQGTVFALVKFHVVGNSKVFHSTEISLWGLFSLKGINESSWFNIIGKLSVCSAPMSASLIKALKRTGPKTALSGAPLVMLPTRCYPFYINGCSWDFKNHLSLCFTQGVSEQLVLWYGLVVDLVE